MKLNDCFFRLFQDKARDIRVEKLCLGLGYTAVATADGGIGIAYTYFDTKTCCMMNEGYEDTEGKPAIKLVEKISSPIPLQRTMALAAINALNYQVAAGLPEQTGNHQLLEALAIGKGTRIAMVGLFKPLVHLFEKQGAEVAVHDIEKQLGTKESFYQKLNDWAQVVIVTSTSLLNGTTEEVLRQVGKHAKTVLMGPSTPLVPEAFASLPVHYLAGTVPLDVAGTFRAVRHGTGTPIIQQFGRKVLLKLR